MTEYTEKAVAEATAFREAAIADGWSCRPTYQDHEPMERAATLERDGFKIMVIARPRSANLNPSGDVCGWGPDRLAIRMPKVYDWATIQAGARTCSVCNTSDVETARFGFAGRACLTCQPSAEAKLGPRYYE